MIFEGLQNNLITIFLENYINETINNKNTLNYDNLQATILMSL